METVYRQGQAVCVGIGSDAASKAIHLTVHSNLGPEGKKVAASAMLPTFEILARAYQPAAVTGVLDKLTNKISSGKFQGISALMQAAKAPFELNAIVQEALRRARELDPAVRRATV